MSLCVWHNDHDWVIAESANEALLLMSDSIGYCNPAQYQKDTDDQPSAWYALPDDQLLTLTIEDEGKFTKTCADWCRENGKGLLGSLDY